MAWARVDDSWWCHPKVLGLSMAARGVWMTALSWSCQMRRDVIPSTFIGMVSDPDELGVEKELVGAGLWVEVEGGWRIHDWGKYQQQSLSEMRSEAGAKGGRKSRPPKQDGSKSEANGKQHVVASGSKTEATGEAGTRPDPSRPNSNPIAARKRAAPNYTPEFETFWNAYPRNPANGKAGGGGTKLEAWAAWQQLSEQDQTQASAACVPHAKALAKSDTPPKHAHRFLKLREFDDVMAGTGPPPSAICQVCRGAVGPTHDDTYCDELRAGMQVRHA